MALTWEPLTPGSIYVDPGLFTNWQAIPTGYQYATQYSFLLQTEVGRSGDPLVPTLVNGDVTIGIGFDLYKGGVDVLSEVLIDMGFDPVAVTAALNPSAPTPTNTAVANEYGYVQAIQNAISAAHAGNATAGQTIATLNSIMASRASPTTNPNPDPAATAFPTTFSLTSAELFTAFQHLWQTYYFPAIAKVRKRRSGVGPREVVESTAPPYDCVFDPEIGTLRFENTVILRGNL